MGKKGGNLFKASGEERGIAKSGKQLLNVCCSSNAGESSWDCQKEVEPF